MDTRVPLKTRLQKALDMRNMKAADLCLKTGIPKGAVSYYLSGKSEPKADRLYLICKTLGVAEAWMLGYDVPIDRPDRQKNNDAIADIVDRLYTDEKFLTAVTKVCSFDSEKLESFLKLID